MIDARRWALVEAWLALGLRVSWLPSYEANRFSREQWVQDEGARREGQPQYYIYVGMREWHVRDDRPERTRYRFPNPSAPSLSTEALTHELAHYLVATEEQRLEVNFGAGETEERETQKAEAVINAMLNGVTRIVDCFDGRAPR